MCDPEPPRAVTREELIVIVPTKSSVFRSQRWKLTAPGAGWDQDVFQLGQRGAEVITTAASTHLKRNAFRRAAEQIRVTLFDGHFPPPPSEPGQ